jgi:hypothetical protein
MLLRLRPHHSEPVTFNPFHLYELRLFSAFFSSDTLFNLVPSCFCVLPCSGYSRSRVLLCYGCDSKERGPKGPNTPSEPSIFFGVRDSFLRSGYLDMTSAHAGGRYGGHGSFEV